MGVKKTSIEKIKEINYLRQRGFSLPEISKTVNVSKSTVFRYIQGIEVLPQYLSEWAGKRGGSKKRKRLKEENAYQEGQRWLGSLTDREKLFLLIALYWSEGTKKDFSLSNTDPDLIKIFVIILRTVLGISQKDIRASVRIYEDLDKEKCLAFWSSVTGIPKEDFVNVNVLPGKKKGKLEYGMCRVRVLKGGDLLKKIFGIKRAIIDNMAPIA